MQPNTDIDNSTNLKIGLIPARWGSSRFEGKPVALIKGQTMIQRVYERAKLSKHLDIVVVLTDDMRIYNEVSRFNGKCLMITDKCETGTDRVALAIDSPFKNAEIYLQSILDEINNLGLEKNSLILVMSDHGISVGEKFGERAYGAFCYDYTLRTFTYFLSEEFISREITQQIRTVDFMSTILDYLEIPFDNNYGKLDGVSLMPLIRGISIPEQIAYSETGNPLDKKEPPKEPNTKSVRTSKWKLILNQYDNSKELYNLELDPNEEKNLFGKGEKIESFLWEKLQELGKVSD